MQASSKFDSFFYNSRNTSYAGSVLEKYEVRHRRLITTAVFGEKCVCKNHIPIKTFDIKKLSERNAFVYFWLTQHKHLQLVLF